MNPTTSTLLDLMAEASGETREAIMGKGRRRPLPVLRWMVALELTRRGFSNNMAARELGIDHATFRHGRIMLEAKIPAQWAVETEIEGRFKHLIIRYYARFDESERADAQEGVSCPAGD